MSHVWQGPGQYDWQAMSHVTASCGWPRPQGFMDISHESEKHCYCH